MTNLGKEIMTLLTQLQLSKLKEGADDAVLDELDDYMKAARELAREKKPEPEVIEIVTHAVGDGEPGETTAWPPADASDDQSSLHSQKSGRGFAAIFPNNQNCKLKDGIKEAGGQE